MKTMYSVVLTIAVIALLATSIPVQASTLDDLIRTSAENSYVFFTLQSSHTLDCLYI